VSWIETQLDSRKKEKSIERTLAVDEGPRADTTLEALASLKPAFKANGTVTAGNSSQVSDGAAMTLVVSRKYAEAHGLQPIARLVKFAVTGCAPELMGIGPADAIPAVLRKAGISKDKIDLIELNEAFAAQSLAVLKSIDFPEEKVNVNGGAIALGHPLGCTGTKLTVTLLNELKRRGGKYGIVSMCIGGGMGAAGLFEML
jgi:acetyl-CoA acyltransferase